mgnify:FL=1
MTTNLSINMIKFCHLILSGKLPKEAARLAGYPPKRASGLLRSKHIQEFISGEQTFYQAKYRLERDQLTEMLLEAHSNASNTTEEVCAIRELGKLLGLYPATKKSVKKVHQIEELSDNELLKIARGN